MAPKDIEAIDDLERAIREEPTRLPEVVDSIERQLASDDRSDRLDAGRALRAAAGHDGTLVEPYAETFLGFLSSEQGSLQLSGAIGLAEIAGEDPEHETVLAAVSQLVELLEETVAPSIEEATIRALAYVGMEDPAAVASVDEVIGRRFPEATFPTKTVIVKWFVRVVREEPALFPRTIEAYVTALEEEKTAMARFVAEALAALAESNPDAIPEFSAVRSTIEALESDANADPRRDVGSPIREAAETFRRVASARESRA